MTPTPGPTAEMPFLDHLEELRWRLIKAASALVVASVAGFLLVHFLDAFGILIRPVEPYLTPVPGLVEGAQSGRLLGLGPGTAFFVELKLSLLLGLVLAFPVILYQAWAFLAPALQDRERRLILPSLYLGLVLFAIGVVFAYGVALPMSLSFFSGIQQEYVVFAPEANEYLSFVMRLLFAFGVVFELPVLIVILTSLGLASPAFLRAKRRHAIVIMVVLGAVLSPGDTPQIAVLMVGPMAILYELSIYLSSLVHRAQRRDDPASLDQPDGSVERLLGWVVLLRWGAMERSIRS